MLTKKKTNRTLLLITHLDLPWVYHWLHCERGIRNCIINLPGARTAEAKFEDNCQCGNWSRMTANTLMGRDAIGMWGWMGHITNGQLDDHQVKPIKWSPINIIYWNCTALRIALQFWRHLVPLEHSLSAAFTETFLKEMLPYERISLGRLKW